jgi:DNA modification methylase
MKGEMVNLVAGQVPADYHCTCTYCSRAIGELRREDGSYYSRLERRAYYDASERGEGGHIAKTPLHVARWAIQAYTEPDDWVLDPTIGAGTTAVEALTQGRNVAGMEVQFGDVLKKNVKLNLGDQKAKIRLGDARNIKKFLDELDVEFALVVNNPPYSGDEHAGNGKGGAPLTAHYAEGLPNLAFLKEGPKYWEAMARIYEACIERLAPGGHFVTGIKDMMRARKPLMLHEKFAAMIEGLGLEPVGTAFLKHHPTTLHLNTYETRWGVRPPLYQTINVFKKS